MLNEQTDEVAVDQVYLAAYLRTRKIAIKKTEVSGRFGLFFFDASEARPEIDNYISGRATVEPRKFTAAVRELRSLVDNLIASGNGKNSSALVGGRP